MKKNMLDNYLICDLYQVKNTNGYLDKQALNRMVYDYNQFSCITIIENNCEKVGRVIVKKNNFFLLKYYLHEAITNIPLNTLYITWTDSPTNHHFTPVLQGFKNKYHTFIVITDLHEQTVKLADLKEYCDKHKTKEEYRQELKSLLKQGKSNLENAKRKADENIEAINSIVRSLLYKKN